jgi:hypothetical protein
LGEVLSECGIVDADALFASEKLSPAAPSAFTAAALVMRFFFEACLTPDIGRILRKFLSNRLTSLRYASVSALLANAAT